MWKEYIERTKNKAPSKFLVEAVGMMDARGSALDMGSGSGVATKYLADKGFLVEAMDAEPYAQECIQDFIDAGRATFVLADFKEFMFQNYALINASYALPFIPQADFQMIWQRMVESLETGGIFVGELFGAKDSWNRGDGKRNFHSRDEIEKLLVDWEVIELVEEDREGGTAAGSTKRWHVLHIVARKLTA